MTNAVAELKKFANKFDPHFLNFLELEYETYKKIGSQSLILLDEIKRMFLSGGKRLRPAQLYYSYLACGGKDEIAVLDAAISIEMLHTFAVIHDDIIDKSDTRRGQPTSYIYLKKLHRKLKLSGPPGHFALSAAILAGDLSLALADKALTNSPFPRDVICSAKHLFDDLRTELVAGEFLDVYAEYLKKQISEDDVVNILKYKTGYYTCGYPLKLGAVLAGAPKHIADELFEVGVKSGIAFQIQDDILGVFGDEKEIGKSKNSDLLEGKKTLLLVKTYERSDGKQKKFLNRVVGNPFSSRKDLERVRQIIIKTGAREYSRDVANKLIKGAKTKLEVLPLLDPGREFLLSLTQFLLNRKF